MPLGKNLQPPTGAVFVLAARPFDLPEENPFIYGEGTSWRIFMQTDPIGYKDDLDLYSYVGNDPFNRSDPTGNDAKEILSFVFVDNPWVSSVRNVLEGLGKAAAGLAAAASSDASLRSVGMEALHENMGANIGVAMALTGRGRTAEISTFRETVAGETFSHYGYSEQAAGFAGGLRPGGFATTAGGLTGVEARAGLSLPHATAPNAVYIVSPTPGTLVCVNPVAASKFGQLGGLPEFQFPLGTGPGTVSGPRILP